MDLMDGDMLLVVGTRTENYTEDTAPFIVHIANPEEDQGEFSVSMNAGEHHLWDLEQIGAVLIPIYRATKKEVD